MWDALQAARATQDFVHGITYAEFAHDLMRRSAVERQIEILGEALNRVRRSDPDTAADVPDIAQIVGMRNVIIHEYGTVDVALVWEAAVVRVPGLAVRLEALLGRV